MFSPKPVGRIRVFSLLPNYCISLWMPITWFALPRSRSAILPNWGEWRQEGDKLKHQFEMNADHPTGPKGCTYLQNIFLIRIQNKFKALIPHWVYVIIEVSCSLPAVRGWGDEKLHIGIWSVNCRRQTQIRRRQLWFIVPNLFY